MFCEKCGSQVNNEKFCPNCGHKIHHANTEVEHISVSQDKWYIRLAKVVYIGLYIPLPFVLFGVWTSSDPYSYYSSYSHEYISYGSYGEDFWYSLLTLVVWIVILRPMKIAVLYVFTGQKAQWKKEFKKFF